VPLNDTVSALLGLNRSLPFNDTALIARLLGGDDGKPLEALEAHGRLAVQGVGVEVEGGGAPAAEGAFFAGSAIFEVLVPFFLGIEAFIFRQVPYG